MSYYQTLLSVAVEHSYNSSGVCPSLNYYPTDRTRAMFENTGLLFQETIDGIQIVFDRDRVEALEMCSLDPQEPLSFDFRIYSSDPDFRSYTEPYGGGEDEILYFDNRVSGGSGKQVITASEFVSGKDFRQSDSDDIKDILDQKDRLLPPEFVLRIFTDNNKGSLLKQWIGKPPTIYSIRFNSRQRYWKYYLLGKIVRSDNTHTGFSIVDPDNKVEFETTGEEMLPNQSIAYTFRSKQQIPLYERYPYRFQLRHKGKSGETTIIPSLPVASVKQFGKDSMAEQEMLVSEIYINS